MHMVLCILPSLQINLITRCTNPTSSSTTRHWFRLFCARWSIIERLLEKIKPDLEARVRDSAFILRDWIHDMGFRAPRRGLPNQAEERVLAAWPAEERDALPDWVTDAAREAMQVRSPFPQLS